MITTRQMRFWMVVALGLTAPIMAQQRGSGGRAGGGGLGSISSTPTLVIRHLEGIVSSVDTESSTVKFKSFDGSNEITVVVKSATPILKNAKRIKFSELKSGDTVKVDAEDKDGSAHARTITVEKSAKNGMEQKTTSANRREN